MASLRSFILPIRASLPSITRPSPSLPLSRIPVFGRFGLSEIWLKNLEPVLLAHAPRFEFMSSIQKKLMQNLNLSGRKLFAGSSVGLSVVTGVMYSQPNITYAMDEYYADGGEPSGFLKDDLNTFWSLARKFQLPAVLLITVLLGWRHPITLIVNVALLLFCTKPSPLSIYMFVEQLRQRDMRQDPRLHKAKLLYTKNVKVDDYKILCLAKIELRDVTLDVIGILGGWWVFQTSKV